LLVLSAIAGRVRLRVEGLRGDAALAGRVQAALVAHASVRSVRVNTLTGSVLVVFDAGAIEAARLLRAVARGATGAAAGAAPGPRGPDTRPPWHALGSADVTARLGADAGAGLSTAEASARLAAHGPNRLPVPRPKSALAILSDHLTSLPVLLLGGAAALSLLSGAIIDAAIIVAVVGINAAVGYVTESRVERVLMSLQHATTPRALARRDGRDVVIAAEALVVGDVVQLAAGHEVPADVRLLDTDGLSLDESALTGESLPVTKRPRAACAATAPIPARVTMAYAGTVVAEGAGRGVVVATGEATEVGRIRALVAGTALPPTPLERQLDRLGRRLVVASLGACGVTLALGLLRGIPALEMVRTVISLAVAAVPEGLPAVATTTLALGVHRMMTHRTLVRRLSAVEALGATTVICADKTGTLTENRMAVHGWYLGIREYRPNGGPRARVEPDQLLSRALAVGALCNEAELDDVPNGANGSGSATESALLAAALDHGLDYRTLRRDYPRVMLRPRADGANWMATVHWTPHDRRLVAVKGAPVEVLARCRRWLDGEHETSLTAAAGAAITAANARLAGAGMRVLGLAFAETDAATDASYDDLVWLGLVALTDPVRPGVAGAVAACRAAGIRVVMITGDQAPTAAAIYRALGPSPGVPVRVCDAAELAAADAATVRELARTVDVFARVSPAEKYQIVRALQADGEIVAMTGDGINDAAALRAADIGVAMGARGTDVARDVADIVLLDDDLGAMVTAVAQGRTIQTNIGKALRFLLATNFSEILATLGALALGVGRPLSAIQFLWINLVSDVLPALALAVEPPEADVMRRPPRDPRAEILDGPELARIGIDGSTLAAATLGVHGLALARHGTGPRATTLGFSTLTAAQLMYALSCRSRGADEGRPRRAHPLLFGVVGGTLALQLATVMVAPLRRLLGTTALSAGDWTIVAAGVAAPTLLAELRGRRPPPAALPSLTIQGGRRHAAQEITDTVVA
jgi:Ca2+-transporting ATPase